ncbi:hypothetical protein FRC03_001601 [Tulasnella sp. 419]|nr:hypothetical protein FRC03_001601 [Tulasnella sp. 419]
MATALERFKLSKASGRRSQVQPATESSDEQATTMEQAPFGTSSEDDGAQEDGFTFTSLGSPSPDTSNSMVAVQPNWSSSSNQSSAPPSTCGVRRTREMSEDSDTSHRQMALVKRMKTYTVEACTNNKLPPEHLDTFIGLGDPALMLIDIKAHLTRLEVDRKLSDAEKAIKSPSFKACRSIS